MVLHQVRVAVVLVVACVTGLLACGSSTKEEARGGVVIGDTLTVYSSLPLRGPFADRMRALVNGEKLAISDAGATVGERVIKYASLDDATGPQGWDASATSDNARKAAQDPTTIAYLGDADFGATAISLPILNEAGVAQVSPAATYPGFTSATGGTEKGEPDKYEPSGVPTFARVIPAATVEGEAQAAYQRAEGCRRTLVLAGKDVPGRALAVAVAAALPKAGIRLVGPEAVDLAAEDQAPVAEAARAGRADCVFVGTDSGARPVALWNVLHAALPAALLFAPADLARPGFLGALSPAEQAATRVTQPILPRTMLNARGRDVLRRYRERFGEPAPVEMLYGYEAMALVLDTLRRAGDRANERTYVAGLLRTARRPDSVLGAYAIRRDGDTTLRRFSGFRVRAGIPVFDRVVLGR